MRFLAHLTKARWRARFALVIDTASNMSTQMGRDDVAHCRCQRGAKEYRTRIALCDPDGALRFDQELQFDATLYADKSATAFDPKPYTIAVVNESDAGRAPLLAQVDLASMLRLGQPTGSAVERLRVLDLSPAKAATIVTLTDPEPGNDSMLRAGPQIRVLFRAVLCAGTSEPALPRHPTAVRAPQSETLKLTAPRTAPSVNSFSAPRDKPVRRSELDLAVFVPATPDRDPGRDSSDKSELPSLSALKESGAVRGAVVADISSVSKSEDDNDDDGFDGKGGGLSAALALLGASPPSSQVTTRGLAIDPIQYKDSFP